MYRCSTCQHEITEILKHQFLKGSPEKPEKVWYIHGPLYFNQEKDEGYCSPDCSVIGYSK